MMDYRKTILIMTDADGAETAKAIKLRLTQADASVAVIVIGVNELQNSIVEAAKNYLWKKDGFTRRRWEAHRLAQAEKALDEIPKGVPKFDATKLKHVKMQNILMRYRPALMLYLTPQELGIGLSARNKLMPECKIIALCPGVVGDLRWIYPGIDGYWVENAGVLTTLANHGVAERQMRVVTFPFGESEEAKERKVGETRPSVLVEVPPADEGAVRPLLNALKGETHRFSIDIAAGEDREAYAYAVEQGFRVCNEGGDVAGLRRNADVVLTRPHGGVLPVLFGADKQIVFYAARGKTEIRAAAFLAKESPLWDGTEKIGRLLAEASRPEVVSERTLARQNRYSLRARSDLIESICQLIG